MSVSGDWSDVVVEKPLYVRVAEALGCRPRRDERGRWYCTCPIWEHAELDTGRQVALYGYDSDAGWACTGPLIGRFGITVMPSDALFPGYLKGQEWSAVSALSLGREGANYVTNAYGPTACEAIANLIVAMAQAGKLPREEGR